MRLKFIVITFGMILSLLISRAQANDIDYTKISENIFFSTRNWQAIDNAARYDGVKSPEILKQLKAAYLNSPIAEKNEKDSCSFISRILDDVRPIDTNVFKTIDVDLDGRQDVIYTGYASCVEGDVTLVWYGTDNGFEVRQKVLWHMRILKIYPGKEPRISSVVCGCCAELLDEYTLGNLDNPRFNKTIKIHNKTIHPENVLPLIKHFNNHEETVLRSSPDRNDLYDIGMSDFQGVAVFGNILSRFMEGASGYVLGEHKDTNEIEWWYIVLDEKSDSIRYHSPFRVNVGWIEKQTIKETDQIQLPNKSLQWNEYHKTLLQTS